MLSNNNIFESWNLTFLHGGTPTAIYNFNAVMNDNDTSNIKTMNSYIIKYQFDPSF